MQKSVRNFFSCVTGHPSLAEKNAIIKNLLICSDSGQEKVAKAIIEHCPQKEAFSFSYHNLEDTVPQIINEKMDACDMFIFIYDSSMAKIISPHGPDFIPPLKQKMAEHWKKSVLLREYGHLFEEAFSEDVESISSRNNDIITLASSCRSVTFRDNLGGVLHGTLSTDQKWKSLDGRNHFDLMPGEVATRISDLSGSVTFGGTFLSTVPFAIKYGVIDPVLHVDIEQSRVVAVRSQNRQLEDDFNLYLDRCAGNRIVEEFGIGTNLNVNLHGRNASFEERHAGLHLGLGGGERASHHLDLVFSSGVISFDDRIVFDGSFHLS